jgi:GrpB-like predicted nucleotidyltransferase (UPF0157 family)
VAGYPIEIVSYDPRWGEAFEKERVRLADALGHHVLRFEHMGSTSVPGLDSKPIIDISAAVADLAVVPSLFDVLGKLEYQPIVQKSPDRYDLWRVCGKGHPSHILHFMVDGSDAWFHPIIFRNALRADPTLRTQYSELKRQLASACGDDIDKYGTGKTDFVRHVLDAMLGKVG